MATTLREIFEDEREKKTKHLLVNWDVLHAFAVDRRKQTF
jgi:hypothetical protein